MLSRCVMAKLQKKNLFQCVIFYVIYHFAQQFEKAHNLTRFIVALIGQWCGKFLSEKYFHEKLNVTIINASTQNLSLPFHFFLPFDDVKCFRQWRVLQNEILSTEQFLWITNCDGAKAFC